MKKNIDFLQIHLQKNKGFNMTNFFKKVGVIILSILSITGIVFMILFGLKKRNDLMLYKNKLKKKLNDIDKQKLNKINKIELKANHNRTKIEKTLKIPNKKKRLSKLADLVNKRRDDV